MNLNFKRLLDQTGLKILNALQENARISFSALGRDIALSSPAVIDRVRKMEQAGIITGYHAHVAPDKVGFPVTAFILVTTRPEHYPRILTIANTTPEILECHHVSGEESFVMKVVAASVVMLETCIEQFNSYGQTKTLIVLSSPVAKAKLTLSEEKAS